MIKLKYIIILFISIFLMLPSNVTGDVIAVEITQTGQIVPDYNTSIYMKSQNITVYLSMNVHEITEYTLKNPTNSTINLTSLLPFSGDLDDRAYYEDFPKPYNLILKVDGIETNYNLTIFEWNNQKFNAIIFNVSFEAFEEIKIIAEYDRSYKSNSDDWRFEYLTMTGTLWNHSIEYAKFEFYVDSEIKRYEIYGMDDYKVLYGENYTLITREFYDWIPKENIRISLENEHSRYNPFFWNITFPILIMAAIIGIILSVNNIRKGKKNG